jgi:hypothetical protein
MRVVVNFVVALVAICGLTHSMYVTFNHSGYIRGCKDTIAPMLVSAGIDPRIPQLEVFCENKWKEVGSK